MPCLYMIQDCAKVLMCNNLIRHQLKKQEDNAMLYTWFKIAPRLKWCSQLLYLYHCRRTFRVWNAFGLKRVFTLIQTNLAAKHKPLRDYQILLLSHFVVLNYWINLICEKKQGFSRAPRSQNIITVKCWAWYVSIFSPLFPLWWRHIPNRIADAVLMYPVLAMGPQHFFYKSYWHFDHIIIWFTPFLII